MVVLMAVLLLSTAATIALGTAAHRRRWSLAGGPAAWGRGAAQRFGNVPAAIAIALTGWVLVALVGLAMGFLAKALQGSVDEPVFRWVQARVAGGNFTKLNDKLTYMGNTPVVEVVCLVAVIILTCAYRRRRWLPAVAVAAAFVAERYLQKFLGSVVDRGHPPTTFGTYPSGGVGRLLGVYSAIIVLVIVLAPTLSRAWRGGLWTGLVTAGVVEAFTRVYLSKHWLTDAVFALPFGVLLLVTNLAAVSALVASRGPEREPDRGPAPVSDSSRV